MSKHSLWRMWFSAQTSGPEVFEGEVARGGFGVEEGFVEEVACVGEAALPEVVRGVVAGFVVGEIDAEASEDCAALAFVPTVGEQDSADVPEDGLDGGGAVGSELI